MVEQRVPLFSVDSASLVFIEAVTWAGFMELDAETFHIIEFERRLSFRAGIDAREDFDVLPIYLGIATFFMSR